MAKPKDDAPQSNVSSDLWAEAMAQYEVDKSAEDRARGTTKRHQIAYEPGDRSEDRSPHVQGKSANRGLASRTLCDRIGCAARTEPVGREGTERLRTADGAGFQDACRIR